MSFSGHLDVRWKPIGYLDKVNFWI